MNKRADLERGDDDVARCWWGTSTPRYRTYHDEEWGRPVVDDHRLFEKICLEGFQAGLSWLTILNKRDAFRRAFVDFDFERVARFNSRSVDRLVADASIVRHRGKIESTVNNARRARELVTENGSLAAFFWQFEPPPKERPKRLSRAKIPAKTETSTRLSKELKKRGWTFVGPTTMYAFMQAMGLVNDHLPGCDAHAAVERERRALVRPR